MAQFDGLPPELLRNIFSFIPLSDRHQLAMRREAVEMESNPFFPLRILSRECDPFDRLRMDAREKRTIARRTLRSLCLVSNKFRVLAEPFLYSSWKPHEEARYLSVFDFLTNKLYISLRKFLRTLIGRPELADHVRYVELENWDTFELNDLYCKSYGTGGNKEHLIDSKDAKLFIDAAKKAHVPGDSGWLSGIAWGSSDALVALLLTQVHNIEGLSFMLPGGSVYPEQIIAHAAFASAPPSLYSFSRLSHISYANCDIHKEGFDLINISIYFFLPAMKVIEGWQCVESAHPRREWHGGSQKTWLPPEKKSKVTSIELSNSEVDERSIASLLGACEALESFTLSGHSFGYDEESLVYHEVFRALQLAQSSLKQFRLDTLSHGLVEDNIAPSASFKNFPKLASLNLELDILLGNEPASAPRLVDVLPTSIASLTLRYRQDEGWCRKSLSRHLWELVQYSTDYFPCLNRVELIRFSMDDESFDMDECQKSSNMDEYEDGNGLGASSIGSAFQEAGIDFSFE